jgi:hypothetical protein
VENTPLLHHLDIDKSLKKEESRDDYPDPLQSEKQDPESALKSKFRSFKSSKWRPGGPIHQWSQTLTRIRVRIKVKGLDPDPHLSEKMDPDPDKSEKGWIRI